MPQYRQHTRVVTVASGTTVRTWDKPSSVPHKNLKIFVTGYFDSTTITEEVFLGGKFVDSTGAIVPPFSPDVDDHIGGVSQGVAAAIGTSLLEASAYVYQPTNTFPMNQPKSKTDPLLGTVPIAIEFSSTAKDDAVIYVTFISETISTNV